LAKLLIISFQYNIESVCFFHSNPVFRMLFCVVRAAFFACKNELLLKYLTSIKQYLTRFNTKCKRNVLVYCGNPINWYLRLAWVEFRPSHLLVCWYLSLFFVVILNCSRQMPGYIRFVPKYFLLVFLKPFKDEKTESNYLYNAPWFPRKHCFLEGSQVSFICPSGKRSRSVWSIGGTILTGENQSTWFKDEITLVCISRWRSYRAVNTLYIGYANQ
jgi:hypothetical protein